MTSLKQLQNGFQKALLDRDTEILSLIPDTPREKHDVLLGIYQYAYGSRLKDFLRNDYPHLLAYLGDEQFETLSGAYIGKHPSQHPNARWYGQHLPAFMKLTSPYQEQSQVHELADLECALNDVFDEREDPALTLPQLADIAPDQWPTLVFSPVIATRRKNFITNITELWNALVSEETPPDVKTAREPQAYLIYRDDYRPTFRPMSYEEAMMWDKMSAGVPFGVLCELSATYGGEDDAALRAATFLQGWIASGLVHDLRDPTQ